MESKLLGRHMTVLGQFLCFILVIIKHILQDGQFLKKDYKQL